MSRGKRGLSPRFLVFCEGDTEHNYIQEMKKQPNYKSRIFLKSINMKGGGYKSFLDEIKTSQDSNYLAKFIFIDLDVLINNPNEKRNFIELCNYCIKKNKYTDVPIFLIVSNPDFEYISCLHCNSFKGNNYKKYIIESLNFRNLSSFKNSKSVYSLLNSNGNSKELMISKLNPKKYISNLYDINSHKKIIRIKKTIKDENNQIVNGSNINEFFEVLSKIEVFL